MTRRMTVIVADGRIADPLPATLTPAQRAAIYAEMDRRFAARIRRRLARQARRAS